MSTKPLKREELSGGTLEEAQVEVAKASPGATRWLRTVGFSVAGLVVAVDKKDNTFLSVTYEASGGDLGGGALPGDGGIGLAKFSPDGRHLWSRGFANINPGRVPVVNAMAVDDAGNLYITGSHSATASRASSSTAR
jgi:hypothetical protein